ncbi:SH3 domain-containing protein [Chelativorans sp. YIM 93263]|uniref:SH3 domain-containing protein n=1 Tax=Chelativorans sp. YIM 93263 TaxID=2906648 RepID=UPI00237988B3|nr:SH3 domain-containing protein [Chelativorans sp. YIM 93263]
MLKPTLRIAALAGVLLTPTFAAAVPAVVTTDLNIRTGPGTQYQRMGTIPDGYSLEVESCASGYNWCHVYWRGRTGWVSGNYLAYLERSRRAPFPQVGVSIGVVGIEFGVDRRRLGWRGHHWRGRWDWDRRWRHHRRWDDDRRWRGRPPRRWYRD